MRQLAFASLAVLALAGCSSYDNRAAVPASPAAASPGATVNSSNPIDSTGRSDSTTAGSASNAASGSTVTQRAAPRAVR
jgi:uncharacterized protein YcfL